MGNILVVEDDDSLRRVMQTQLERLGHETSAAERTERALDLLRKEPQDLVICDLNLPGKSGIDLLKEVRAEYPETTVVIVTGYGTIDTAVEAIRHGAYDYLTKPVHPDELGVSVAAKKGASLAVEKEPPVRLRYGRLTSALFSQPVGASFCDR